MVWDILGSVASAVLPSLLNKGGSGGGTITVPQPKPVVPSGPAMLYEGRQVVPIFTQQGVSVRPGYTQAYDTVTGRRIVVAKSKLREIATAPAGPSLDQVSKMIADAVGKAVSKLPVPKVNVPASAAPIIPLGEVVEYAGKQFATVLPPPGSNLAAGARAAVDLATGKRAVLPASAFAKKAPEEVSLPPPAPAAPDVLGALLDFKDAAAKRALKEEAIQQWAVQRTSQMVRDPFDFSAVVGTEGGVPAVRGTKGLRSPVPVVGGLPARPPISLGSPRLPGAAQGVSPGAAAAAGAAGGAIVGQALQDCVRICEPEKDKEQQRKARLPRRSCRQQLEELMKHVPAQAFGRKG